MIGGTIHGATHGFVVMSFSGWAALNLPMTRVKRLLWIIDLVEAGPEVSGCPPHFPVRDWGPQPLSPALVPVSAAGLVHSYKSETPLTEVPNIRVPQPICFTF